MLSQQMRSLTRRRGIQCSAILRDAIYSSVSRTSGGSIGVASYDVQSRFLSSSNNEMTEREKGFFERGWLDERGLTVFETLHELQTRAVEVYADNELLGTYNPETEKFEYMKYKEFASLVNKARFVLKDLGVSEYGKIGLISNNRWEWVALASAAFSLNAVVVPMYEAQLPADWSYIVNDSGCSVVFCANQDIFDRVQRHVVPSAPMLKSTLCFDAPEGEAHSFKTAMAQAEEDVEGSLIIKPTPDDLANLIYTSGTTGKPKGVELTHLNFTSNVKGSTRVTVPDPKDFVRESDRTLAFLPWAHSYGQTCELWVGIAHGGSSAVCRGVQHILDDLQMVKPSVLYAVPTLYKRVYDGVQNALESSSPTKKKMMQKALQLGLQKVEASRGNAPPLGFIENLQYSVLDSLVLSKIRDRFGGNLRHGFVAGAACPKEVLDFMDTLGIEIFEGYGLTETSPIITMNAPGKRKVGCVGVPIGGVTVHIVDEEGSPVPPGQEGEICCVGPNVMKGYYRNQEATDEVISVGPDGKSRMFHTGDVGQQDEEGFVRVTGRIKEQYKLENGKYVVPTPIEEAIGMSRFILQVVLCGANRPYNVALLAPDWGIIRKEFDIDENVPEEELANDERVKELIDAEIHDSCYKMKKFEVPTKWAFIAPCTVANSMLTAKMSIRRHKVMQTYADLISHLYSDESVAPDSAEGMKKEEKAA